jgi:hypothetical protein
MRMVLTCRSLRSSGLPTTSATMPPRAGRVQVAEGARRGGAERSTWTRLSTAAQSRGVGSPLEESCGQLAGEDDARPGGLTCRGIKVTRRWLLVVDIWLTWWTVRGSRSAHMTSRTTALTDETGSGGSDRRRRLRPPMRGRPRRRHRSEKPWSPDRSLDPRFARCPPSRSRRRRIRQSRRRDPRLSRSIGVSWSGFCARRQSRMNQFAQQAVSGEGPDMESDHGHKKAQCEAHDEPISSARPVMTSRSLSSVVSIN